MSDLVNRFDSAPLSGAERTPQGGLRVPARITRTGVFTYRGVDAQGRRIERREYRAPEEVFRADSMKSLDDAPVTVLHPTSLVTPETFSKVAVGHARTGARREGDAVVADLVIQDGEAVKRVDSRDLREISAGYRCRMIEEPGTTPAGERYDARQVDITYNHVGIGPAGWGRMGGEVAIRMDGGAALHWAGGPTENEPMKTERIDGIDYEVGTAQWAQAREKHQADMTRRLDALEAQVATLTTARDTAQARADAATAEITALKQASSVEAIDARVAARTNLQVAARAVLGAEVKFDSKSDREIKLAVLAKLAPETKFDGKSDDYLNAFFDARCAQTAERNDSLDHATNALFANREDADDDVLFAAQLERAIKNGAVRAPATKG